MNAHSDTRSALLEAARQLFGAHGYDGTSVRELTRRARANLGAVTYHFGSKQSLYEAVVTEAQRGLLDRLRAVAETGGAPLDRLEAVVRTHFGYLAQRPDVRRLLQQVLLSGRELPAAARGYLREIVGLVSALIAEGQAAGAIRAGDPRLLTIAVMSQPIMLNVLRGPLKAGGVDLEDAGMRGLALDNATRFVRAGLEPAGEE